MRNITRPGLSRLCSNLSEISGVIGTPFYVYDWPSLQENLDLLLSLLSDVGLRNRGTICLAFFSLPNVSIFERLLELDEAVGVDCNTIEEVVALQRWGWEEWDRGVFSGGVLSEEELLYVAHTGCRIHAASKGNLEILLRDNSPLRLGLRLDLSNMALKGIRLSELDECFNLARGTGNDVVALHAYPGTRVENIQLLTKHAEVLMSVASQYPTVQEIDLSGGFDYNYGDRTGNISSMVDFQYYFSNVKALSERFFGKGKVKLTWEPGRIMFAGIGFFVTKVVEVRRNSVKSADIYVDSSFVNLPAPKLLKRQHQVVLLDARGKRKEGIGYEARICGATTLSTDQLLPFPSAVPEAEAGDFIVILDVGAYGYAGSYNFLGKSRPAEVLVDEGGWKVVRRRQNNNHLLEGLQDVSIHPTEHSKNL